jgi:hypothetical protein
MTLEVVDMSCPELLPNGQYSDYIVDHVTQIIRKHLMKNGSGKYCDSPISESFFSYAFDDVLLEMNVNISILIPVIFDNLVNEYIKIAKHYNQNVGSADYEERQLKVKLATIVAQEACANSYKFTEVQATTLLEFIYRFGLSGNRYGLAIQALYTSIPTNSLIIAYNMFVDHFDPSRQALPVLYIHVKDPKLESIKNIFIGFISHLYEKIKNIDHINYQSFFNTHACMLISSMISCNFLDDFLPMITDLLHKVDIPQLLISPRFAKSVIEISKEYKNQNNPVLEEIIKHCIDDNVILALDPPAFIFYGSIIFYLKKNQNDFCIASGDALSPKAQERLKEIEAEYAAYHAVIAATSAFDNYDGSFASMKQTDLISMCDSIDSMIPVFPDFFKHEPFKACNVIKNIFALIPKLVNISMRDSSKDLDVFRFRLFAKLIELSFSGPYVFESSPDIFSTIIGFYNTRFDRFSRLNFILKDVHMKILSFVEVLLRSNKFFKTHRYRANFYNYLKMVMPRKADFCMIGCFHEVLVKGLNLPLICHDIITASNKLELSMHSAFSLFITNEIQLYLQNYQQGLIDDYLDGALVIAARLILAEKVLSKTETILVKTVINRFSSFKLFTD